MPHREPITFNFNDALNSIQNTVERDVLIRQLTFRKEIPGEKPVARETIKVKQNLERKRIFSLVNDFGDETVEESRMILTRILGHKMHMPGSG